MGIFAKEDDANVVKSVLKGEKPIIMVGRRKKQLLLLRIPGGASAIIGEVAEVENTRSKTKLDQEAFAIDRLVYRVFAEVGGIRRTPCKDGTINYSVTTLAGRRIRNSKLADIVDRMLENNFFQERNQWSDDETALFYATAATMLEEQKRGEQFNKARGILKSVFKGTRLTATLPTKGNVQEIAEALPGNGEDSINEQIRGAAIVRQYFRTLIQFSEDFIDKGREINVRYEFLDENLPGFIERVLHKEIVDGRLDENELYSDVSDKPYYRAILALYNHFIHDEPMVMNDDEQPVIGSLEEERKITRGILRADQQRTHKMGEAAVPHELASGQVPQAEQAVLDAMQPTEKTINRT